jgi:hypothetical protein
LKSLSLILISLSVLAVACSESKEKDGVEAAYNRGGQGDASGAAPPALPNPINNAGSAGSSGEAASSPASAGKSGDSALPSGGTKTGGGAESAQLSNLTAAAYNDALNFDDFFSYLNEGSKIKLPEQSPFSYQLSKEDWKKLIPAKLNKASTKMDISLVLDVTGSMGDELQYLQKEWKGIIDDLKILLPELAVRFSLVAYRDSTDNFVTRSLPFSTDITAFQAELATYNAAGGGDLPEAVDQALLASNALEWSSDPDVKKLLFWVADAPAHEDKEVAAVDEILKLRDKGVSIYPIAASGVDAKAEMMMRLGALISGGEYIFLTDDSGIGDAHAKPHIRCYQVERLNQLLLRILTREASGKNEAVKAENILRTVGSPQDGVCGTDIPLE